MFKVFIFVAYMKLFVTAKSIGKFLFIYDKEMYLNVVWLIYTANQNVIRNY